MKDRILPILLESCIESVKKKITKTKRNELICSSDLLDTIHTDICGFFFLLMVWNLFPSLMTFPDMNMFF